MICRRCDMFFIGPDAFAVHCPNCVEVLEQRMKTTFARWAKGADAKGPVPKPRVPYLEPLSEKELLDMRGKDGTG